MKICAIIPACNEEGAIARVVRGVLAHCDEAVVVDDGSRDGTPDVAREAGATVLRLPRRSGKGAAMRTGFEHALRNGFEAVITLDADGQHDPAEIPRFIRCAEQRGESLVTGSRMANSRGMPFVRWFTNWLTSKSLSVAFGYEVQDSQCGYRLIRTDLLRGLPLSARKYDIETEVLVEANRLGARACEIPIHCVYAQRDHTHTYRDIVRFLRLYGRHYSRWTGIFRLAKFAWTRSAPFLLGLLKILSFPLLVVLALGILTQMGGGSLDPGSIRTALEGLGILAPVIFVLLCALKPLVIFPVSGLTFVAGAVFGLWYGTLLVAIGGLAGAVVGYYFARFYGRGIIERHVARRFPSAEEWVSREGWTAVLFLRLLNVPWDWVSYAAGLSKLSFRGFATATLIAVLPIAFLGTMLGAAVWHFPSWKFFAAFGTILAFGTVTYLVRRHHKLRNA